MVPTRRNVLISGFSLTLRHGRAVLWTYLFNLALSALFLLRTHGQLQAILNASLANQSLISGFDLTTAITAMTKIRDGAPGGTAANFTSVPIYLLLYFLLVPGTLFCYQTATPARLSTLLQSGIAHFWRFVRITIISLIVFAVILGPLLTLQNRWTAHVDENVVGRSAVVYGLAGLIVIGLVAAVLRIYFDLVEVYTVQLGLQLRPATGSKEATPDRRVRRAFGPAWRALRHNFARLYVSFILLTLLGLSAVIVTAHLAMHMLAQPHVWPMFLVAQFGLFLMLFTRFWQRGAETVLTLDYPITPEAIVVTEPLYTPTPPLVPSPITLANPDLGRDPDAYPISHAAPNLTSDPVSHPATDPIPDPEPPVPSTPPDPGVFRHEPVDPLAPPASRDPHEGSE